jgi:hypothetical protein
VLRRINTYLLRRRFNKLFVQPFKAREEAARKAHRRGICETRKERSEFLHAALRGAK